jgi:hypothetical protein
MSLSRNPRRVLIVLAMTVAILGGASSSVLSVCGPFTDVPGDSFCAFVQEIFYLGITTGTSATVFDPSSNVTRLQMAAFLSRTVDKTLLRGNARSSLGQFWTPQNPAAAGLTTVGALPFFVETDGADLWASGNNFFSSGFIWRIRESDGKLLDFWTTSITAAPQQVLVALGKVYVPGFGNSSPSKLYQIDPRIAGGVAAPIVASNLGDRAQGIAFDGSMIWTANGNGTVSRVNPGTFAVVTTPGFLNLQGIVYDGTNMWVTDQNAGTLLKLSSTAGVLLTVTVGAKPGYPSYDGTNLWVPNFDGNSVTVVRVSNGNVLSTLTGNGLNGPASATFDGQRVLVANQNGGSVSLWKAADLTSLGNVDISSGSLPNGGCSDGVNSWIANGLGLVKF